MLSEIGTDRLSQASRSTRLLSHHDVIERIVSGVMSVRPDNDYLDAKTWAELMLGRGVRILGHDMWAAVFREAPQDKADAIINALCAD